MRTATWAMAPLLLLAGCGSGEDSVREATAYDIAEEPSAGEMAESDIPVGETPPAKGPQIAYSYRLAYRGEPEDIAALQQSHADLCRTKGSNICHLLSMSSSNWEYGSANGEIDLEVAADAVSSFIETMNAMAGEADAELAEHTVSGEDLSDRIIDVEARLASRRLLRDRLMTLLQTRQGSVSDLVEAERAVAEVTGEIEQAESRLADMTGRVRYSHLSVSYNTDSRAVGFTQPIREAVGDFIGMIGSTIGVLIYIVAILIPVSLFLGVILFLLRKVGVRRMWPRRWRLQRRDADEPETG